MYYNYFFFISPAGLLTPALRASCFAFMRGLGMGCATGFVLCISSVYIEKSLAYLRFIGYDACKCRQLRILMLLVTSNRQILTLPDF